MSETLKDIVAGAVEQFITKAEADIKEYVGELTDEGKAYLREAMTKIGQYTVKAETETDENEKAGWRHRIKGVVSGMAQKVYQESVEAQSFIRGLLSMAGEALSTVVPAIVKKLIGG